MILKKTLLLTLFIFLLSSILASAACTFQGLTVSKNQVLTNDDDLQESTISVRCDTTAEIQSIDIVQLTVNSAPTGSYFKWTPSAGFTETSSAGNIDIALLKSRSHVDISTDGLSANYVFGWTISPSYGQRNTNTLSYYWHTTSGSHVGTIATQVNFQTLPTGSVYSDFNSLSFAKQDVTSDGTQKQTATITLNKGAQSNLQSFSLYINKANSASKPYRGFFQWTPTKGFIEYSPSNYGNTYVQLLPLESTFTNLPDKYILSFTWLVQNNYGTIPINDASYSWIEANSYSFGTFSASQTFATSTTPAQSPLAPQNLNGVATDKKVKLYWTAPTDTGGSPIQGYTVEYSTDNTNFITVGTTTSLQFNITNLQNDIPYTINVRATNNFGASNPSTIIITPDPVYLHHLPVIGQSIALGVAGSPALTITQPYSNKLLQTSSKLVPQPLVPLVEKTVEKINSAMANFLTFSTPNHDYQSVVSVSAISGSPYSEMKKGTLTYQNTLNQIKNVSLAAQQLDKTYDIPALALLHVGGHYYQINDPNYEAEMVEWQHDYETDINAITGKSDTIPFFIIQMSTFEAGNFPNTSRAQLQVIKDHPDQFYLVTPGYPFIYANYYHFNSYGYRQLGEYYGKVMKKVLIDHEDWKPLMPETITRTDNIITAKFHVPVEPLQFDTTLVVPKTNYGFEYSDKNGIPVTITSVSLASPDTVQVTLSNTPTGTDQRLRYAYTSTTYYSGANVTNSAHGNLRDSDTTPSQYGNPLYNWAVHFDEPITSA